MNLSSVLKRNTVTSGNMRSRDRRMPGKNSNGSSRPSRASTYCSSTNGSFVGKKGATSGPDRKHSERRMNLGTLFSVVSLLVRIRPAPVLLLLVVYR